MHMFGDYGMGMGGGGMIFMGLFWIVIIVGVIYLIKSLTDKRSSGATSESPEEILKKRYAKGEISTEEFEKVKKDIQK